MLSEIDPKDYIEIKASACERISQHPLINAVLSGIQAGSVYADSSRDSFFVSTKSGFSLYSASGQQERFDEKLFDFLRHNNDIPDYIHIYSPASSFLEYLGAHWSKHKIRRRAQFRYFGTEATYDYELLLPVGYRVASIQQVGIDLLEQAFRLDFGKRYWNSTDEFLANAIGACILTETGNPAAICYSACVVDGLAEMDTLVLDEHRGKRFMRIVSEPFFNMTYAKRLTPHWDTFVSNTASYVMAQKFGLKAIQEYELLSLFRR